MAEIARDRAREDADRERWSVLEELESWLHAPMLVLSFAWLLLVVVELGWGTSRALDIFGVAIWIAFLGEFTIRVLIAPDRLAFLRRNWLTVIALIVPALRLLRPLRVLRFARGARSLRLERIVGTANRGMNALRASLRRRGVGYVVATTVLVTVLGAGGMLVLEPASDANGGFASYGEALWWTSMLITTMGTDFWPRTLEGRILCFLLALYGFGMFGYITASFASFFVGRDAASQEAEVAGARDITALREDIAALRRDLGLGRR